MGKMRHDLLEVPLYSVFKSEGKWKLPMTIYSYI